MASLEWLFRGDLKDSHYSFEIDLSLCIWPPASSVQSCVTVPRKKQTLPGFEPINIRFVMSKNSPMIKTKLYKF